MNLRNLELTPEMIEQVLASDGEIDVDLVYRQALHTVNAKLTNPATVAQWKKSYPSLVGRWKELSIIFIETLDDEKRREWWGWLSATERRMWINVSFIEETALKTSVSIPVLMATVILHEFYHYYVESREDVNDEFERQEKNVQENTINMLVAEHFFDSDVYPRCISCGEKYLLQRLIFGYFQCKACGGLSWFEYLKEEPENDAKAELSIFV